MAVLQQSSIGMLELIIVVWSSYYFLKILTDKSAKPFFVYALTALLLLFLVYTIFAIGEGRVYIHSGHNMRVTGIVYFRKIVLSIIPIYAFYYFSKNGAVEKKDITKYIWIFMILLIIGTISSRMLHMEIKGEEGTDNFGYKVLSFLPLLSFYANKSFKQFFMYILCMLLILTSMKRGAILTGIVISLFMFYYMYRTSGSKLNYKFIFILLFVGIIIFYAVNELMEYSSYFQERVDDTVEGNSSARDAYYEFFFNIFMYRTTTHEFWFGQGAFSTLFIWGNYAHNDWLEIAINQGMFGVIVFLIFTISFLSLCFKKQDDIRVKSALWMLFGIFFLRTLFSMSYDQFSLYYNIVLGYCLAQTGIQSKKEQLKHLAKSIIR